LAVLSRAVFLFALVALISLAHTSGAAGEAQKTVTASTLTHRLRLGSVVLQPGSLVRGDVRFDPRVKHRLTCQRCRFDGDVDLSGSEVAGTVQLAGATFMRNLLGAGATFGGIVDLRGSHVVGQVDMSEAHFKGPVLASAGATFDGAVDFSLATFSNLVSFKTATFNRAARFGLAWFGGDAVFAGGTSAGGAVFARASFQGSTDFHAFTFDKSPITFEGAFFKGHSDFSDVCFAQVSFNRARFGDGATFAAATFAKVPPSVRPDTFGDVESDGDLNFSFAEIHTPIDFETSDIKGTLSFGDVTADIDQGLHFLHVTAGAFEMSVGLALAAVNSEDQRSVLALIESSAKARGDLGTANDAHYARQVLKSQGYWLPWHVLDFVFYRTFAGYLVRPSNPLLTLLALAASMALYRAARAAGRVGRLARVAARTAAGLPRSFVQTLSLIVPARWLARKGGEEAASIAADRSGAFLQMEAFAYRVLFACTLIGLANSNPTLRQMFDAIN
jgi:uncharacterized protein YjbI with pentapeptide repeats